MISPDIASISSARAHQCEIDRDLYTQVRKLKCKMLQLRMINIARDVDNLNGDDHDHAQEASM